MQFLQVKMLSQRRGKAAMVAVDARIRDAEVYVVSPILDHSIRTNDAKA
jgi:hypothetical protein